MAEQPPAFVVVDKRKYTSDGAIREGYVQPEPEQPRVPTETLPPMPPAEPEFSSAKVVTMPARTPEPVEAADDLADEDMGGALRSLNSAPPRYDAGTPDFDAELTDFEHADPIGEPRSKAETAAQDLAYRQSSKDLDAMLQQANPGMQSPGAVTFEHVIQSFYLSAIMAMGAGAEPGQKPRIDILGARQSIDMLAVLEEKTRGNLLPQEQQLLQGVTFEMRMMFLELTNAISKQALQGAPAGPGPGRGPAPPGTPGILR